jgi:hypothetical protein
MRSIADYWLKTKRCNSRMWDSLSMLNAFLSKKFTFVEVGVKKLMTWMK